MNSIAQKYCEYYEAQAQGQYARVFQVYRKSQRGHGIGQFLSGVFRTIFPYMKAGAKNLGSEIFDLGIGLMKDHLSGKEMKQSIETRVKSASQNLGEKASTSLKGMVGLGLKGPRLKSRHQSSLKHSHEHIKSSKTNLTTSSSKALKHKKKKKSEKSGKSRKNKKKYKDVFQLYK